MNRTLTLLLSLCLAPVASGAAPDGFELVGTYRGQGGQFASVIGPGPTPGSEYLYTSYLYSESTFDIVAVDPSTGDFKVFPSPVKGEYAVRAMAVGPDGNVYGGTAPRAHLIRLETRSGKLVDLGQPSATEEFIWDVAFGPDGKLYAGTQPNAKLVRYDPATGALEDLGRMDPAEDYAHFVVPSKDGFVYVGIGTSRMNVVAYHVATRERRDILPQQYRTVGQARVYEGGDGNVYALAGSQHFRLHRWTATPVAPAVAAAASSLNRMHDGRIVTVDAGFLAIQDPRTHATTRRPYAYQGREIPVFRLGLGPDGRIYGSSVLPARLLRIDEEQHRIDSLGEMGGGEVYRLLSRNGRLLLAAYGCPAPFLDFDAAKPFQMGTPQSNPALVSYAGADNGWRPLALVDGPDGKAYVGAIPGYGKLGGPLCSWDASAGVIVQCATPIPDHGVSALAVWKDQILGGTTILGGLGSRPTQKTAKIFLWDPRTGNVLFELEPIPGAASVENLAVASSGAVYGIAGHKLFVFDVEKRRVTLARELPFPGGTVYDALRSGPDGRLWGLAGDPAAGIFAIDPSMNGISLVARPPKPITAGFLVKGGFLYFASGADVYRYGLPRTPR